MTGLLINVVGLRFNEVMGSFVSVIFFEILEEGRQNPPEITSEIRCYKSKALIIYLFMLKSFQLLFVFESNHNTKGFNTKTITMNKNPNLMPEKIRAWG